MNAVQVREALRAHWKPDQYLVLEECGQDSMRQGRKIDMLVVSIWKSRGHYLDAIEIKVSLSDWKKELETPAKADWWWERTNRFWLAVPAELIPKVKDTVPEAWGLLSVGEKVKIVKQAPTRPECTPLPWTAVVGAMRGATGAGAGALMRARSEGREQGFKEGRERASRESGDEALRLRAEAAERRLAEFCEGAGIKPEDLRNRPAEIGQLWAIVRGWKHNPIQHALHITSTAKQLEQHAARVADLAVEIMRPELEDELVPETVPNRGPISLDQGDSA